MASSSSRYYNSTTTVDHLSSGNDPCSLSYTRSGAGRPSSPRSKKPSKLRKIKDSIKKLFGSSKSKKSKSSTTGFVMPSEYKSLHGIPRTRSSVRSRRSSAKMALSNRNSSGPSIPLTTPTVSRRHSKRKTAEFRIHSYGGAGAAAAFQDPAIRFSHPVVSDTIRPSTARSTATSFASYSDRSRIDGEEDVRSSLGSNQSAAVPDDDSKPLRPKEVWRYSMQSVDSDGRRESYTDFKDRLDGHSRRADRESVQRPTSLPYIARMSSINLLGASSTPVTSPSFETGDLTKHRSHALSILESVGSASEATATPEDKKKHRGTALSALTNNTPLPGKYVLAIVPRNDMPDTAVQISADQHPLGLMPGSKPIARPQNVRPHSIADPTALASTYNASLAPPVPALPKQATLAVLPNPVYSWSSDDVDRVKPAQAVVPKVQHQLRDSSSSTANWPLPPTQLDSPARDSLASTREYVMSGALPAAPQTPPATPMRASLTPPALTKRKAAPQPAARTSKPLPAVPARTDAPPVINTKVPSHHIMNNGGFPLLTPTSPYSADPKYQRRSVDAVEAKYLKEQTKKVRKPKSDISAEKPVTEENADKKLKRKSEVQSKKLILLG